MEPDEVAGIEDLIALATGQKPGDGWARRDRASYLLRRVSEFDRMRVLAAISAVKKNPPGDRTKTLIELDRQLVRMPESAVTRFEREREERLRVRKKVEGMTRAGDVSRDALKGDQ